MKARIKAKSLAHILLMLAAAGGIAVAALMAPNALQILGDRHRPGDGWMRREAERRRIREALERLRKRRLVAYDERGKETYITVTAAGRTYVRKFEFDALALPSPPRWDEKWRMIVFDIPEHKARERNAFRVKLGNLGFLQLQKSVWVYPYGVQDELDFVSRFLEIERYVLYFEANSLGEREGPTRKKFGLLEHRIGNG